MVKPTYYLQARVDFETEQRRQRLQKRLECSTAKLVDRALRELEENLEIADQSTAL